MLAAIQAMDELSGGPAPSQLRLSHTRLRITRASADSRSAFSKIVRILSIQPEATAARAIAILEQQHRELREAARNHLTTWPHARAQVDWPGYCRSSAEVRRLWREMIRRERELLYPLL
jgi:hypothetical protein